MPSSLIPILLAIFVISTLLLRHCNRNYFIFIKSGKFGSSEVHEKMFLPVGQKIALSRLMQRTDRMGTIKVK